MVKSDRHNDRYNESGGSLILAIEEAIFNDLPLKLFGNYLLQLGGRNNINLLERTKVLKQIYLNPALKNLPADFGYSICGDFNELPFLPGSIDVAVLFHVLEFSKTPKEVLRELFDTLTPEGYAVIFVFNSWSFFRLLNPFRKSTHTKLLCHLNANQLKKWLLALDFYILSYKNLFLHTAIKFHKFKPLLGGVYMFLVQKKIGTLIPVRAKNLKQLLPISAKAYVEPTTRS